MRINIIVIVILSVLQNLYSEVVNAQNDKFLEEHFYPNEHLKDGDIFSIKAKKYDGISNLKSVEEWQENNIHYRKTGVEPVLKKEKLKKSYTFLNGSLSIYKTFPSFVKPYIEHYYSESKLDSTVQHGELNEHKFISRYYYNDQILTKIINSLKSGEIRSSVRYILDNQKRLKAIIRNNKNKDITSSIMQYIYLSEYDYLKCRFRISEKLDTLIDFVERYKYNRETNSILKFDRKSLNSDLRYDEIGNYPNLLSLPWKKVKLTYYNESGERIKEKYWSVYNGSHQIQKEDSYWYDRIGQLNSIATTNFKNAWKDSIIYIRRDGLLLESSSNEYSLTGELEQTVITSYVYNENGHRIMELVDNLEEYKYDYEYDDQGNWVRREKWIYGKLHSVSCRKYLYSK